MEFNTTIKKIIHLDSNRLPIIWDIFTFSIKDWEYMFWRVIFVWPSIISDYVKDVQEVSILYIYNIKSNSKLLNSYDSLNKKNILLYPIMTVNTYFQEWFFEILWNEKLNEKNVDFPICFIQRHLVKDQYRDQDNKVIEKQTLCWNAWIESIYSFESLIFKSLWLEIPTDKKKEGFQIFSTHTGSDFICSIKEDTSLGELVTKVLNPDYFIKWYDFDSVLAIEALCSIELFISILSEKIIDVDTGIFPWVKAFFEKNKWKKIDWKVLETSKKLLSVILNSRTSELRLLWKEAGKFNDLKRYIGRLSLLLGKL